MPAAASASFAVVAEGNQREFKSMIKWHARHAPNDETMQLVQTVMSEKAERQQRHGQRHLATDQVESRHSQQPGDSTSSGSGKRKAHVHRKHRGNCPKHLMHEIQRSGGVVAPLTPPRSESAPAGSATVNLPSLIPNMVGRGLGEFLAGVRNPAYDIASRKHRPAVEHPNFQELCATLDGTVEKQHESFNPRDLRAPAPEWLLQDKLLMVDHPLDQTHYRKKYEMKSHMEAVRMMGKALLREFSGAAFK